MIAVIGLDFVGMIGFHAISQSIYEDWYRSNTFREYNNARFNVTDYMPSSYSNELSTKKLELSENDYLMLNQKIINDDFFSIEYFKQIKENFDKVNVYRKQKERYHNISQAFYFNSGRLIHHRTLFILYFVIGVLAFVSGNRNNRLAISLDIVGTIVIIAYFLMGNRLPPWVIEPIYIIAIFIALVEFTALGDIDSIDKRGYPMRKYIVVTVLIICFCERLNATDAATKAQWKDGDLTTIIQYAEDSEDVFLLDNITACPYPYIDVYGALAYYAPGQWDNIIRVGNWDVEHPARNAQKEALGIDSVIHSLVEGKSYLITSSDLHTLDMYKNFFQEHYDTYIYFQVERSWGDYSIVSVHVTDKEFAKVII